jgi:outer membrane receptor protein involved in Fe transport
MRKQFWTTFLVGWALLGQTSSTEILGLVTDSSGAVVPGAKVTITRTATGESRSAVTNQDGEYTFPLIDIGEYRVHVEMPGFRSQTVTGLRVELQQKARVDFRLEVGALSESVEVAAQSVVLQTEDAAVGQVIENKRVIELPLNGRNITMLAVMTPGAQFGSRTGNADGQGGYPIPGQGISVIANGQREIHQSVSIDGVEAIMPLYNHTAWTPSIDAIEEFKVQTGSYSAEYGQGAGAHIQVSVKSGTNQLRGTLFEFLRNDKLDAENYFLNFERPVGAERLPKDRLRRNQFGIFLGGPIVRNKTFWSFNYEGRRENKESVNTAWWPNADFRKGDFSALLRPAVNPATGRLFRGPIVLYDPLNGMPFQNDVIPASRLHPGAQNVVSKFLPSPDFQQADILDFNVRRPVAQPITGNQFFGRIDHNLTGFDKLFGRIAIDRAEWLASNINPNFPEFRRSPSYNLATQWVHTFSQNMFNEFRFGINHWGDNFENPRTNTNFDPDSLGIGNFRVAGDGNRKLKPIETGVPSVGFGIGDSQGRLDDTNTYQFANNLSLLRGKHNFKMGGQYIYVSMDRLAANLTRGRLTFGAQESGFAFASLLLGYPNRAETAEGYPATGLRANRGSAYFTDDWKVNSRLTLNVGFRWDYYGNPVDSLGNLRTMDFTRTFTTPDGSRIPTLYPAKPGSGEAKIKMWEQDHGFFMPRLGIAYRPASKWVLRTGAGWFSSSQLLVNYSILNLHPPLSGSEQYNAVTDPALRIPVTVDDQSFSIQTRQFRPGSPVLTLDNPFVGARGSRPVNVLHIQPNHQNSDVWQWSFDIQRELPNQTALTVTYVGSKNTHVANSIGNFNAATPSPNTNFQPRRPYPRFFDPATPDRGIQDTGSIRFLDSYGNGFYHGLQVKLDRRFGRGLSYGFAYAFSKALGEGENGGNEGAGIQNPLDRGGSRARYSFDQTHSAVLHWVWELPFAHNLHGLPGAVLKGWQTNGILTLRSGFPFTPTVGSGDLNTGDSDGNRPDLLKSGRLDNPNRKLWFDPTAFRRVNCNIPERPDLCHYGNSGKNILDSPGQRNVDLSVLKNFRVTERIQVQFRTELFNALNTPYFGEPNNLSFVSQDSIIPDGPRVGEIRSLRTDMRIIQFGLKLYF